MGWYIPSITGTWILCVVGIVHPLFVGPTCGVSQQHGQAGRGTLLDYIVGWVVDLLANASCTLPARLSIRRGYKVLGLPAQTDGAPRGPAMHLESLPLACFVVGWFMGSTSVAGGVPLW